MSASRIIAAGTLLLCSCGQSGDGADDDALACASQLLPGDLVITEVMANPEGPDEGREFFEIYNASRSSIELSGLVLELSKVDGSSTKQHTVKDLTIEPGQYLAMGGVLPEFRPPYVAYGYGSELGPMVNSGGILSLHCGTMEVDTMTYREATSGKSQILDGNLIPDHLANNDFESFCDASTEYAPGDSGSPGAANAPCSIVAQDRCLDDGVERDVVNPDVGELVITEVMADPSAVPDAVGEWFELVATSAFDLNGLVAGKDVANPSLNVLDPSCLRVSPGDYLLFARSSDASLNGGLPAPDYLFSFALANSNSSLFVGVGDVVIDEVSWASTSAGRSDALDPNQIDAAANDDPANWCKGQVPFGDGDRGSPGQANRPCNTSGMCMDGDTLRPAKAPLAADVTITEFMPDPAAVSDFDGEWFEVHFAGEADLNGLQLGRIIDPLTIATTIDAVDCETVAADSYVVFARKTDPTINGGLPITGTYPTTGILLAQSTGAHNIFVAIGDELLDVVEYQGSEISAGVSRQRDGNGQVCNSTIPYGDGDLGTPGEANVTCP